MNEFGFDHDVLSNLEVQCGDTALVSRLLISLLCFGDMVTELLMKFVKVDSKFSCSIRGKISFSMNSNAWIVSFVCVERRNTRSSIRCVVVGEFGDGKEFFPVVLLIIAINPNVLFQCLISSFRLAVSFRMITGGEV